MWFDVRLDGELLILILRKVSRMKSNGTHCTKYPGGFSCKKMFPLHSAVIFFFFCFSSSYYFCSCL